ncbi:MAG: histidine phosphatase family protein [Cyanobacteria bacterium Co-bin13]|nr:histidine phosphatase family protein [Cyanobacteria bacterium Co-bin13]
MGGLLLLGTGCGDAATPSSPAEQPPAVSASPKTAPPVPPPSEASLPEPGSSQPAVLPPLQVSNLSEAEIWARLQQAEASYVVLLRHAIAPGTGDPAGFRLEDCTTQRNLSEAGRQQASRIGAAFRSRNIAVRRVLSSQWCRCLDTAALLDLGAVEPFAPINSFFQNQATEASQTAQLRQFLADNADQPGVIVMVTHQVNITALSNIVPRSGESVVFQVGPGNQLELLGRLPDPSQE